MLEALLQEIERDYEQLRADNEKEEALRRERIKSEQPAIYRLMQEREELILSSVRKIANGGSSYDVIFPSDYMVERMAGEHLLHPINWENIPNAANIDERFMHESYDPEPTYSVPYTWGTMGILYNTTMVDEAPDSWQTLLDPEYAMDMLMLNSPRDTLGIALVMAGHSLNSTDPKDLEDAKQLLIEQKPLVLAYVVDEVKDKMIGGEAAVAVVYSGEMLYIQEEVAAQDLGYTLEYVIPEEGTNLWLDSWVIPREAKNKRNAELWIDFLCRPDIALRNFEYITYSTPNTGTFDMLDEELQENKALFPDAEDLGDKSEVFNYLGSDADNFYNELWKEVKSD